MANLDALIAAGLVPANHSLTPEDIAVVNDLSAEEVDALIGVRFRLGDDFLQRNIKVTPNCFL